MEGGNGMEAKLAYSLKEAAEILHCGVSTLRQQVKAGTVKAAKPGRTYIIPRSEILRLIGDETPQQSP